MVHKRDLIKLVCALGKGGLLLISLRADWFPESQTLTLLQLGFLLSLFKDLGTTILDVKSHRLSE